MSRMRSPARGCIVSAKGTVLTTAMLIVMPSVSNAQGVNYSELEEVLGEPVTTSVTGKPQRASETPAAVTIITQEDIRHSPAKDIVGLIQAYAGIDVARWTAGHSDVSIRGGVQPYNPRLLVLVNGQQVYLDHYGMTDWGGISVQLEDIQQIEIVRGPTGALFGFNAVSGVINIITINPLQTEQFTAAAEVGTDSYTRVSASAAVKLSQQWGVRLSGGHAQADELDGLSRALLALDSGIAPEQVKQNKVAGEIYGKLGEQTEATFSASRSFSRKQDFINVLLLTRNFTKFTSFGGRLSHDASWGIVSGRVYRNHVDISIPVEAFPEPLQFHNKVFVASADALVRVNTSSTVRAGVEYRDNQLVTKPGYPGATRYSLYALNGMWEGELSDALSATLASRIDHLELSQEGGVDQPTVFTDEDFDRSLTTWSFNGALSLKLSDASSLRASAGRGVQAPSLFSFGSRLIVQSPFLPFPIVPSGNPFLAPSTIWSGEVGITHVLGDRAARLEVIGFYNRTEEIISSPGRQSPVIAAPPQHTFIQTAAANVGEMEAFGLEASLSGHISKNLNGLVNYTWTHARQNIAGETGTSFAWPILLDRTTPAHKIKAQISYERGSWLGAVAARYTSDIQQLVDPDGRSRLIDIADALAVDAKLAFAVTTRLTLEIAGENLTGAGGVDLSPIEAQRRLRAGARVRF